MPSSFLSSRSRLPVSLLVFLDIVVALGCARLAEYIRFGYLDEPRYSELLLIQALLVVLFSFICGVYNPWRGRPLGERFGVVLLAWLLSFTGLMAFLVMTKSSEVYSRLWIGTWIVVSISLALLMRFGVYLLLMTVRRHGRNSKHVLVIGTSPTFEKICKEFEGDNSYGYLLDTIITHTNDTATLAELQRVLANGRRYDECWLCLPLQESQLLHPVMYALRHSTMDIRFMPGMSDIPLLNHKVTAIGGFFSLDISCSPLDGVNRMLKRMEDLVIGSLITLMILPVLLGVAIAVKLSSPGPVLFKQFRHGADGKRIKVYKFRSMKVHQESEGQVTQATKEDARITTVGAFLRRTSLDELPQFINVLQGRMSIVGPRPHALAHNEYYMDIVESYMKRHKVRPGITGLAQVRGFRGETDTLEKMQQRVQCDMEYLNNWSLWQDIQIIFKTVFHGFVNPNAY